MANEFKKNVGSKVSKQDAEKWIEKFKKERKKDTESVFYGKDAFDAIFSNPDVTGISFFFARKPNKQGVDADDIVLVPTKEDGTLIWETTKDGITTSDVIETGLTCPPYCPK